MPPPRKMKIKLGPKWWDRNGHISTWNKWDPVWRTWSEDDQGRVFEWPQPARCCVEDI